MSREEQINPNSNGKTDNKKLLELRRIRGASILAKGDIPQIIDNETFLVPSQSTDKKYKVNYKQIWTCECPDFVTRNLECKHIQCIKLWIKLRNKSEVEDLNIDEPEKNKCPKCKSEKIVSDGFHNNKSGKKQRLRCRNCKHRFVNEPLKYLKANSKIVTLTMDLYFKGLSLRDIADTIYQFYGLKITHPTVRNWIIKFTKLINNYTKKFKPKLSGKWHADEQNIKVGKEWLWDWNVIDKDTKFLVANNITKTRYIKDAQKVFNKANEVTDKKPIKITTDGLQAYRKAIKKTYKIDKRKDNNVEHIRMRTIRDDTHNNMIERYHNEFREWDKVKRGFKNKESANDWNDAFRLYHNFIKPHMALNGITPSEMAKIQLNLNRNKWLDLLKRSIENDS